MYFKSSDYESRGPIYTFGIFQLYMIIDIKWHFKLQVIALDVESVILFLFL